MKKCKIYSNKRAINSEYYCGEHYKLDTNITVKE